MSPKDSEEQRDEDNAGAGDKSGIGRAGVLQAGCLKCVSREHKKTETQTRKDFFTFDGKENARAPQRHQNSGERKTQRKKKKNGRMVERVFYDDKRGTPQDRAEGEANVGAQTFLRLDDGIHAGEVP